MCFYVASLVPMVERMFWAIGEGESWRCIDSVYYCANKRKKQEKKFVQTLMYPAPRAAPAMPFIYVNMMGIVYPARSHSPRVENARRKLNVENFPHIGKIKDVIFLTRNPVL